jgi:flagellar hook assembly protein FlgD
MLISKKINWDGCNDTGEKVPEGIYYCRLVINGQVSGIKRILVAGK